MQKVSDKGMRMKPVIGFEGLYSLTEDGRVYSHKRQLCGMFGSVGICITVGGKFLVQQPSSRGYMFVTISKGGESKKLRIHRAVAQHFIPNPKAETLDIVNHRDGNKTNNHYKNLEWTDLSGNTKHAWDTGLIRRKTEFVPAF